MQTPCAPVCAHLCVPLCLLVRAWLPAKFFNSLLEPPSVGLCHPGSLYVGALVIPFTNFNNLLFVQNVDAPMITIVNEVQCQMGYFFTLVKIMAPQMKRCTEHSSYLIQLVCFKNSLFSFSWILTLVLQVSLLLFLLPQCCSKGEIYCICIDRSRVRPAWNRTKARTWSSRASRWDILWYLWQIWTSQRTLSGQLFYIYGKTLLPALALSHKHALMRAQVRLPFH